MTASATLRRAFAEAVGAFAHVGDPRIVEAFAAVPREDFLGPPPWRVGGGFRVETTSDIAEIYTDQLVSLDAAQGINNGQPSLWAGVFDALRPGAGDHVAHLGAGAGYYTAILAELVGPTGVVAGYELDPRLAGRARQALAPWPQATVFAEDGGTAALTPADIIVASAGATHPAPTWLAALKRGGRLCFPLTGRGGNGAMLLATRCNDSIFEARLLFSVAFVDFAGLRDVEMERRLGTAFRRGDMDSVRSLRLGTPDVKSDVWVAGDGWFLSRRAVTDG